MTVVPDALQGALAVNLLLQAPQGPFHRLAFSQSDLSQSISLPLHTARKQARGMRVGSLKPAQHSICAPQVSTGKSRGKNRRNVVSSGATAAQQPKSLAFLGVFTHRPVMRLPDQPLTLSTEQIGDLNRKLSKMRHDINNHLAVMVPAAEIARCKPETTDRMMTAVLEQASKITEALKIFSTEFERAFGIERS